MINYWDKLLDELQRKSVSLLDNRGIAIINEIIKIPTHIRKCVLKDYIR